MVLAVPIISFLSWDRLPPNVLFLVPEVSEVYLYLVIGWTMGFTGGAYSLTDYPIVGFRIRAKCVLVLIFAEVGSAISRVTAHTKVEITILQTLSSAHSQACIAVHRIVVVGIFIGKFGKFIIL